MIEASTNVEEVSQFLRAHPTIDTWSKVHGRAMNVCMSFHLPPLSRANILSFMKFVQDFL